MRKVCPKNNEHSVWVNIEDVYCTKCGAKLEEKDMTCQCGHDYGLGDKFCPECGRPLE